MLPLSLGALRSSDLPRSRWELIVVDDGSTDTSRTVAADFADQVLAGENGPQGPASARNRGGACARGEHLVFVDADIRLHPDALGRIADVLGNGSDLGAVFGTYDANPSRSGLISQYRNLLHRYMHLQGRGAAETFWAGIGAVRAGVFREAGGFDARRYPRPQIEDIELGYRIRALGYGILLDPEIQGTHLKRWTLSNMVATDVWDRGVPWMRLMRRTRAPHTLSLRLREKLITALVALGLVAVGAGVLGAGKRAVALGAALWGVAMVGNLPLFRWFARERGLAFSLSIVPLRLLYYFLNVVSALIGWFPERQTRKAASASTIRGAPTDPQALE